MIMKGMDFNMTEKEAKKLLFLVIIAGRKRKDDLLKALCKAGGHFITIYYGKGSVKAGFLLDAFGLVAEENKVIITCLCMHNEAEAIFDMLVKDFKFTKPNTGIAYTIPVSMLAY